MAATARICEICNGYKSGLHRKYHIFANTSLEELTGNLILFGGSGVWLQAVACVGAVN